MIELTFTSLKNDSSRYISSVREMEFKRFMAIWFLAVVLGTVVATGTLRILYTKPEQIERNETQTQDNNHFSVRWMGFLPTYSNQYPDYCVCINNLAGENWTMSLGFQIKNQEDSGYYFQIGPNGTSPLGWTLPTVNLLFVGIDETLTFNYLANRSRIASIPQGEFVEQISLIVKAYYDIALTQLYSQDSFNMTFRFLDYEAPAWSIIYNDNFEDKTSQGWGKTTEGTIYYQLTVSNDYYRSYPYSLKLERTTQYSSYSIADQYRKSFTVPSGFMTAYLIFSIRGEYFYDNRVAVYFDNTKYFGMSVEASSNIWYQFAVPLPIGQTTQVDIVGAYSDGVNRACTYLDDVYVVAK